MTKDVAVQAAKNDDEAIERMEAGLATVLQKPASVLAQVQRSEPTLADQISQYERISRSIAEKIRREQIAIRNEYDLRYVEVQTSYASRISETTSKLEKDRDAELLSLTETTSRKLHDLEQLARRSG